MLDGGEISIQIEILNIDANLCIQCVSFVYLYLPGHLGAGSLQGKDDFY